MINNYNNYIKENLENKEHTDLLYFLRESFTHFRENVDFLKNIWYKVKYNDYVSFEIDIIWFYNRYDYRVIYTLTKHGFNLKLTDFIINNVSYEKFYNFKNVINNIAVIINRYLDYHSYPILKKIMSNRLIVLDYDKFLKEFEEELNDSSSVELFNIIDDLNIILEYKNKDEVKEIQKYLTNKYNYILHAKNFDLI